MGIECRTQQTLMQWLTDSAFQLAPYHQVLRHDRIMQFDFFGLIFFVYFLLHSYTLFLRLNLE